MLGSFFDLRREVEAIAARRERDTAPSPTTHVYEDFDDAMRAFLRSVTPGRETGSSREIKVAGAPRFDDQ